MVAESSIVNQMSRCVIVVAIVVMIMLLKTNHRDRVRKYTCRSYIYISKLLKRIFLDDYKKNPRMTPFTAPTLST